jgi:hypothetical protein
MASVATVVLSGRGFHDPTEATFYVSQASRPRSDTDARISIVHLSLRQMCDPEGVP